MIDKAKRQLLRAIPARRRISALVPAYEVCVCEWLDRRRGPLKIFYLPRESARAYMCGGALLSSVYISQTVVCAAGCNSASLPTHSQADRGVGG